MASIRQAFAVVEKKQELADLQAALDEQIQQVRNSALGRGIKRSQEQQRGPRKSPSRSPEPSLPEPVLPLPTAPRQTKHLLVGNETSSVQSKSRPATQSTLSAFGFLPKKPKKKD